ncbi:MAG: 3'-5' exonuclease [Patescibacteria group bacterium]
MQEIEFVALDCETTGIDSRRDNIIELGAVKFSLQKNLDSFDSLFASPTKIPQFVERLTGIKNSDLVGAPKIAEKKTEFENFLGESILLGHNLPFDLDFLATAGFDFAGKKSLDTFLLAGLILPRGESLALENLTEKFHIAHEDAHRALADAEATRDLLRILLALAQNFSAEKWERIRALDSTEKSWPQFFAELVLHSAIPKIDFPQSDLAQAEIRPEIVQALTEQFAGEPKLIEISANPAEIFAAAEKLDRSSAIFFGSNFDARALAAPKFFTPQNFVDPEKLQKFITKKLSPTELTLAAKLILHAEKSRSELNLTRAENLLFDFVAAEKVPENSAAKILVGDHAALEFENSSRLKIVANAASLPENRLFENSFVLDLPNLELLAPQFSEKIQIWWGLLGLLFREAAPQYGRLDLATATGLSSFSKVIEAGQNLLAEISANLPPRVAIALRDFLASDSAFTKSLRQNQLGEITIFVEPRDLPALDLSANFLLDAALDAADDFTFAKKSLNLPADFSTAKACPRGGRDPSENLPRFFVAENMPDPAAPQFVPAVQKFLLENLPTLSGRTAIIFPNRVEAGSFSERATSELDLPVFGRKIPSAEKLRALEKAVAVFTLGNFHQLDVFQNLILVKLPFIVRDADDWTTQTLPATVLRCKKIWAEFAGSTSVESFFVLDPRIVSKKYGQNFLAAIPQKAESVKISR